VRLLIIDDDDQHIELVRSIYKAQGYKVWAASDGDSGFKLLMSAKPDLILLDVKIPGTDGLDICRKIRTISDVPVVMLSAVSETDTIVAGLNAGADDYVSKPFNAEILLARTRAVLRRRGKDNDQGEPSVYDDGYLTIDLVKRRVSISGLAIKISATEFKILKYLLSNAGKVCTFEKILRNVWGDAYTGNPHYVHTYIHYLRNKIERKPSAPAYILTDHRIGYRLILSPNYLA